jgi:GNAT superfamily N-acetyltransferase
VRFARIIDTEEDMGRIGNVKGLSYYSHPKSRELSLQQYQNLRQGKWKEADGKVACGVLVVCLEDEAKKGIAFGDYCLVGSYEKLFQVSPTGRMSFYYSWLEVFPPFRKMKYGRFLIDSMISYLTCMGISDLEFLPSTVNMQLALHNRGYERCEDGYWRMP